ncbi:NAD-dependent epimerase/dehydratase family protein [bacterium]|nr:NAD-dependent epimerase/dehydratase family protein [bacterium]
MSRRIQTVLVTGATGFLGRHICHELLLQGLRVKGLILPNDPLSDQLDPRVEKYIGNILDETSLHLACQSCDTLVHAAGKTNLKFQGRKLLRKINLQGTEIVCRIAKRSGIRRLVHISSIGVLGAHAQPRPVSENSPAPNAAGQFNTYHRSKQKAEVLVLKQATRDFEVLVVQPCMLWGEGDWLLSSTGLAWHAVHDRRLHYPRQGGSSILDVTDAARGVVAALVHGKSGERYLLAGDNFTNQELFSHICQAVDPAYQPGVVPLFLVHLSGWIAEGLVRMGMRLDYSRDISSFCGVYWWGDSTKAKKTLGFKPQYCGIDVIQRTVVWHKNHRILANR